MTPLRQRFLDDLRLRNYSPRTLQTYLHHIVRFTRHFGRSPDQLGLEEIRRYQLYLLQERQASWSVFNQTVCALRFLYKVTLKQPWSFDDLIPAHSNGRRNRQRRVHRPNALRRVDRNL